MAQGFGVEGKSAFDIGDSRYKDMLCRIGLPMRSFLLLIPVGNIYEDLFDRQQSETKKALITLSSQAKAGNVAPIRATSSMFVQKGAQSPIPETKAWFKAAFKSAGTL